MSNEQRISLGNGCDLEVSLLTYPIPLADQMTLIGLWQTEWTKADYDWLESMKGAYSQSLRIQSAIGWIDGRPVGTASVSYPSRGAEVATVGSVLTHPDYRGLGIGAHLTNFVVNQAIAAGCQVTYLGATRSPRSVYLRCGFQWWNGGVMRRTTPGNENCESQFYAPGQRTSLRQAEWGDLPGFACFVVQPWSSLILDYPRALLSGKYLPLQRCVSNFPVVFDSVRERGGTMCVLIGETPHRVLGFGSLTPEPGIARRHKAVIDVVTHDSYESEVDRMIQYLMAEAGKDEIRAAQVYLAAWDQKKAEWFKRFGFRPVATLPSQLIVAGENIDVVVWEKDIG